MATTVGSINIEMLADLASLVTTLEKGSNESAKHAREMARQWKEQIASIEESFRTLGELLGVGLSFEGIKRATEQIADIAKEALHAANEISDLQQTLGVSAGTIQTVGYAAAIAGGNLDTAAVALSHLNKSVAEANAGDPKLLADFNAIGLSASQLAELIKHPDDQIRVVTEHLAKFADGANKTAIEMALLGRGGAAMAPLINSLGREYETLSDEAQRFAGVTETDLIAMAGMQEELNKTSQQVKGLGSAFTAELLPTIDRANDAMQRFATSESTKAGIRGFADALNFVSEHFTELANDVVTGSFLGAISKTFLQGTQDGLNFANTIKIGFAEIEREGKIAWAELQSAALTATVAMEHYISPIIAAFSNAALLQGNYALAKGLSELSDQFKAASKSADGESKAVDDANAAFNKYVSGLTVTVGANKGAVTSLDTMTVHAHALGQEFLKLPEASKEAASKIAKDMLEATKFLDSLAAKLGTDYDKAWTEYASAIDQADRMAIKMAADLVPLAQRQQFLAEATALATQRFREQTDAAYLIDKAVADVAESLDRENALLGLTGESLEVETEYEKLLAAAMKDLKAVMGPLTEEQQRRLESLHDLAEAEVRFRNETKQSQELLHSWSQTLASDFTSAFSNVLTELESGGNGMKALGDLWKQVVNQMIAEAFRLAVIGPILNSLFHLSGSSAFPTLDSAQGALGLLGGGGLSSSGSIPGGGSYSLLPVGGSAYSGFGSSFGYGSTLGAVAGAAGGALAGYNEYNAAGGGIAGLAGGAAYGIGTFALGGAISAGVSAAAAGGISAGLAAGFAAIPVVGWIALAAMGLNMITGGGLFGTAAKPYGSEQTLNVGQGGADISAAIDEKGKKSLFRGSYYKTVPVAVDQQTKDGVAAFFAGLQQAAEQESEAFGQSTAAIVTGSWHATYDKAGKLLTQESTIAGEKFKESIQDFQTRLIADTLLANMGDASAEAQAIAKQWQSTAADLMAGAQFLSQAELDIKQGHALVEGDTLTQLTAFVTGMEGQGESLIQAYARLSAEVTDVQGILVNLGLDSGKAGEALVEFDDAMVQAAGGLQNLNTLWNDYYQNFFSDSERAAIKLKSDQANAKAFLSAIGEDPTETMEQFRAHFTELFSSLSSEDVVKWLQAAEALAALNADLGTTVQQTDAAAASQQKYAEFIAQFNPTNDTLTEFEHSLTGLQDTLIGNIDQANTLARAAGMGGAAIEDLGKILEASAAQGASALRQFETQIQNEVNSLFGSSLDQLKEKLQGLYSGGSFNAQAIFDTQNQIAAMEAQQAAAAHFSDAAKLLGDLAQDGAVTGKSLDQLAGQFSNLSLDKLAQYLGTDAAGLQQQFAQQEAMALSNLHIEEYARLSSDYLANIAALLAGQQEPYSASDLVNAASGSNPALPSAKPGATTAAPISAPDVVEAVTSTGVMTASGVDRLTNVMQDVLNELRVIRQGSGASPIGRRSQLGYRLPGIALP